MGAHCPTANPFGGGGRTPIYLSARSADGDGADLIERQETPRGHSCQLADLTDLIERQGTLWPQLPVS